MKNLLLGGALSLGLAACSNSGGSPEAISIGPDGGFVPLSQLSIVPYPFDLGVGAVFQMWNLPVACGGGLVDGGESLLDAGNFSGQTIIVGLYGFDAKGEITNPSGPGIYPIILGRPSPGAGATNFANLTYQGGTGTCGDTSGLIKTYFAPSGTVTVTALGDAGLTGSFSAMAPDCTALDGGQINLTGKFSTTPCATFDVSQCIPQGC